MRFSWPAILLAPLAVPMFVGLVVAASVSGPTLRTFVYFFVITAVLSYGASVFVLLPSLYLVSRFTALKAWLTAVIGAVLGLAIFLPVGFISYQASGNNSGPPSGTLGQYLMRNGIGEPAIFLGAGLITAVIYWFLAKPRTEKVPTTDGHR